MNATLVVLSKYPEIFEGFRECVDKDAPDMRKVVVWDCPASGIDCPPVPWISRFPGLDFHIARNANLGWKFAAPNDVVYAGDDTRIIEPDTLKRLQEVSYADPKIGIVGARIQEPTPVQPFVPFVFVYIKRAVIDKIGYLDERFTGYGVEDCEYCYRAAKAGFAVGIAGNVTVSHQMMSTFSKVKTGNQIVEEDAANWKRLAEKYGWPNDRAKIWQRLQSA